MFQTGTPADPLPNDKVEGDSSETEVWDDNDTPPGVDPRTGEDHREKHDA